MLNGVDQERPPLVSIGMPVYNDEGYVSEAIESLLTQSFSDFELILSDNASTDNTSQICRDFADGDTRIRLIQQTQNLGAMKNLETVLKLARGKYFMWAASDDRWDTKFVEILVDVLETNNRSVAAFTPYALMNETGNIVSIRHPDYRGANAFIRLSKFAQLYDDGWFYGLFRRIALTQIRFPQWWGVNRNNPMNTAYPFLCAMLVKGNYHLVGDDPMWFNRIHSSYAARRPEYSSGLNVISLKTHLAMQLRIINVLVASLQSIQAHSKSQLLVISIAPLLGLRYAYIAISQFAMYLRNYFFRSLIFKGN